MKTDKKNEALSKFMAAKKIELELKVGFFVAFGMGLIMIAILVLGSTENLMTRKDRYTIHVANVEGMIPGAKVVLGGIQVGTVESIDFDMERRNIQVLLNVTRKSSTWIREDSTAEIATQGILGDKYVSIVPGTEGKKQLAPGTDIPIKLSKSLSQFITQGDQLMITLNRIAVSVDHLLQDFETGNRSEIFFQGLTNTAKNMSHASEKLSHELENIKLKKTLTSLSSILEKIDNGTGTLGAMVNDPSLYDHAKSLVGQANRNRIVRNLVRKTIKDSEANSAETPQEKK